MPKKALIAASFGSSYKQALKTIERMERKIKGDHPDYDFFRTFTSTVVIKKLKEESEISVKTPTQLMEYLLAQGYSIVVCQPLLVIPGIEFDKLTAELEIFSPKFEQLSIGKPLLVTEHDFHTCKQTIISHTLRLKDDELLLLMGHGTSHPANMAYATLERYFKGSDDASTTKNVLIGTVEGIPNFVEVLARLDNKKAKNIIRKIYLMPLMLVAGEHVKNDLPKWQAALEEQGFEVCPILHGLGEFDEILEMFAQHVNSCMF